MPELDVQIRRYFESVAPPFDVEDLMAGTGGTEPVQPVRLIEPGRGRPWVALVTAAVTVIVVGALSILLALSLTGDVAPSPTEDLPVVDQVEEPVIEEPAEPEEPPAEGDSEGEANGLLEDLPADVESGTLDTPIGQAEWVHLTGDGTTLPQNGDAIEWPSGFAILVRSNGTLWVSPDGIDWNEQPLPIPPDAVAASLTLVDGVYWLISSGPVSIWRSTDGVNWNEYDLGDVIPGPVGLRYLNDATDPVTIAGQTLIHASFDSYFPYADYAPNVTEDGRVCDHVRLAQLGPDRFQVVEDFGEGPDCPEQPVLRMIETDTSLQVIDNDTGDELGQILGADLTDMAHVTEESRVETLLIIDDGGITSTDVPWPKTGYVTLFHAEDTVYAYIDHSDHDAETQVAVWRTDDGHTWEEIGPLSFLETSGSVGFVSLTALADGRLVAWNWNVPNTAWETTDGLNWAAVDLPPLPEGAGSNPVPLNTGWFANVGGKGSFDDGDIWWMKTGNTWYSLAELGINESADLPVFPSAIGNTTFFHANEGRDMWILRLDQR